MSVDLQNATTSSTSLNFEVKSLDQNQSVSFTAYTGTADLLIRKDLLTTPNGIGLNADGIAYDDGTTITSTSWDIITDRIAYLSAIAPNNLNPTILAVNDTISVQNADSAPTKVINTSAGDPALPSEHFGTVWVGGGIPYIMETLDATNLQIKDTSLELYDSTTPLTTTMTASGITTGVQTATWSAIITAGGGIPDINNVLLQGQNAGNQPITNLNGIGINGGTNLYNNSLAFFGGSGAITDVSTINGVSYPPPTNATLGAVLTNSNDAGGQSMTNINNVDLITINSAPYPPTYATPDLNSVLATGNSANSQNITSVNDITLYSINGTPYPPYPFAPYGLTDTLNYSNNASGLSMTNINDIALSTINGSAYPPPSSTQDLSTTLGYGNSAGSTPINMNSQDIQLCNNIDLININGVAYLPAKFSAVFPAFDVGPISNNSTSYGGTGVTIPAGNYQITYTIQLDGNITQGGGSYYMVRGYCFIYGNSVGSIIPFIVNSGFMPSQTISYNVGGGYYNCLTATDYISIATGDNFQLGVYQINEQGQTSSTCLISAVIQAV